MTVGRSTTKRATSRRYSMALSNCSVTVVIYSSKKPLPPPLPVLLCCTSYQSLELFESHPFSSRCRVQLAKRISQKSFQREGARRFVIHTVMLFELYCIHQKRLHTSSNPSYTPSYVASIWEHHKPARPASISCATSYSFLFSDSTCFISHLFGPLDHGGYLFEQASR